MSNSTITGNSNIVIQDVSESTITVNVNGEVQHIKNELSELKELLKNQSITNITYENKVYNIEHINEANFGIVTSKHLFNSILIRKLIDTLNHKEEVKDFITRFQLDGFEKWETKVDTLKEAKSILEKSFVWVISWELRRLFAIGDDNKSSTENKIENYINHCFSTYRICLQLINYIFISKLWDAEIENRKIDSAKPAIRLFFTAQRKLNLKELRSIFQALLTVFQESDLELPLPESQIGSPNQYLDPNSDFNKACITLELLQDQQQNSQPFGLGHCHTAEIALATVFSLFKFYADSQLFTLKKVEYEKPRNAEANYIRDLTMLENSDPKDLPRILKFDSSSGPTYSLIFSNGDTTINLFPFLLDYNSLTNENEFQIFLFECIEGNSDLKYYSVKGEKTENISFSGVVRKNQVIRSEEEKNEIQKNLRLDMVVQQFELAMNTLLDTQFKFMPKSRMPNINNLDRL